MLLFRTSFSPFEPYEGYSACVIITYCNAETEKQRDDIILTDKAVVLPREGPFDRPLKCVRGHVQRWRQMQRRIHLGLPVRPRSRSTRIEQPYRRIARCKQRRPADVV